MFSRLADNLKYISPWKLVWVTIVLATVLTIIMNTIQSYLWWGEFSLELQKIGIIDALVVGFIGAYTIIFFIERLRRAERAAEEEVRNLNRELEQRVAERTVALAESEAKYRVLMEQASDCILITDKHLNILMVNPRACEMTGYSNDELLGMSIYDLLPGEMHDVIPERLAAVYTGKTDLAEYPARRKDGTIFPVESATKVMDDGRLLVIARDASERKAAEREKELLQARMAEAQKMEAVGRLAGGIAHDFNNLLTVIRGDCELALADVSKDGLAHFSLTQIKKASLRASDLTRRLMLFSRQQPMMPERLDLCTVVQDMLQMLGRLIGEDIRTVTDAAPCLMPVRVDKSGMEQVIMNLVVNARDAMPDGGTLTIKLVNESVDDEYVRRIPRSRPGNFVRLSVTDTGVGIAPEALPYIFDPFYTGKEIGKGMGLGLSTAYGIVEQHGGWITVESEAGRGSTFNVYLEADTRAVNHEETKEAHPASNYPLPAAAPGGRILLVEDEEVVSSFVTRTLQKNGYRVFHASGAEEAIRLFEREAGDFQLIFTDVVLPDMSGIQLVEQLRSMKPDLPVLVSSGYTDKKSQWPSIREHGYRFLEKPYDLPDLLNAVREAM